MAVTSTIAAPTMEQDIRQGGRFKRRFFNVSVNGDATGGEVTLLADLACEENDRAYFFTLDHFKLMCPSAQNVGLLLSKSASLLNWTEFRGILAAHYPVASPGGVTQITGDTYLQDNRYHQEKPIYLGKPFVIPAGVMALFPTNTNAKSYLFACAVTLWEKDPFITFPPGTFL